jgi:2-oxoglutarate ferredoxin oxidoreductase subunit delta
MRTLRLGAMTGKPMVTLTAAADVEDPAPAWSPLLIARDRCKGCELCVAACPHHLLALDREVVNALGYHPIELLDPALCTSCAFCARVCPDTVFTIYAPRKREATG